MITVTGTNLALGTPPQTPKVNFGDKAASDVAVTKSGDGGDELTVKVPELSVPPGKELQLLVVQPVGTASASGTFTYVPPSTVTAGPDPAVGSTGSTVVLTGTNLTTGRVGLPAVRFADQPATIVKALDPVDAPIRSKPSYPPRPARSRQILRPRSPSNQPRLRSPSRSSR